MLKKKEAVHKAIAFEDVNPVPYWIDFTTGAYRKLQEHLRQEDLKDFLGNYAIDVFVNAIHGVLPTDLQGDTWVDDFGVKWRGAGVDRGSPGDHPLTKPFRPIIRAGVVFAWDDRSTGGFLSQSGLCQRYTRPPGRLLVKSIAHISEFNGIDAVCLIDDYGTQQGLVMSPEMWHTFMKPRLATIFSALERHGLVPHLHSCGKVTELMPDSFGNRYKMLDPLQPEVMDMRGIKAQYGKQLVLLGGFSTQQIIPYGTVDEVRNHIESCLRTLGKGGGYITCNSIPLQQDVPLENVLTILDVVKNQ